VKSEREWENETSHDIEGSDEEETGQHARTAAGFDRYQTRDIPNGHHHFSHT
jgi:hypothetical protein